MPLNDFSDAPDPTSNRIPQYRLHKPSGKAVVTLGGHDFYVGPYGSAILPHEIEDRPFAPEIRVKARLERPDHEDIYG